MILFSRGELPTLSCSVKPSPRLWLDSGSHNLLSEFMDISNQEFEQQDLGRDAAAAVEHRLLTQMCRRVRCY